MKNDAQRPDFSAAQTYRTKFSICWLIRYGGFGKAGDNPMDNPGILETRSVRMRVYIHNVYNSGPSASGKNFGRQNTQGIETLTHLSTRRTLIEIEIPPIPPLDLCKNLIHRANLGNMTDPNISECLALEGYPLIYTNSS